MDDTQRRVDAIRKERASSKTTSSTSTRRARSRGGSSCAAAPSSACRSRSSRFSRRPAAAAAAERRRAAARRRRPRARSSPAATSAWRSSSRRPSRTRSSSKTRAEPACSARPASSSRFPTSKLELEPRIAESWSPNADGTEWTFKIRQGVTFHSGATLTANDVKTTFDKLVNPETRSNALSALGGVLSPGNTEAPDDATVVFHLDAAERQLPHARQLGQLQRDHHSGRPRPRGLGQDVRRHRALQARELHAQGRREVRPQRRLLGHQGEPRLDGAQVLRRRGADDRRHPGRRGRLRRALLGLGRSSAPDRPERTGDRGPRPPRIASSTCERTRIPSRTSASARPSRSTLDRPALVDGPLGRQSRPRQRQPVRAALSVHRHERPAAGAEHRPGEAAPRRRRQWRASPST